LVATFDHPALQIDRVFDRFFRSLQTLASRVNYVGLQLYRTQVHEGGDHEGTQFIMQYSR